MELPFGIFRSIKNAVYKGLTGRNELVFVLHKALTRRSGLVFVLHKGFEMAKKGREVARGAFGEAEWAEIVGISNSVLHLPRIYTQEV